MNNNFYNKNITPKIIPKKNISKKDNLISSLSEVEGFLNNLNCIFSSIKLVNIIKKFK